ncbi:Arylsulfatase, variant 2 [Chamberlinius hualienensis]
MTGYYPFRTGLQHSNLETLLPAGLPTHFSSLPEELKILGYSTHMVGKWHLGYCNWNYTPTYRGFDTFLGYYTGDETYFSHENEGYLDLRNNTDVVHHLNGTYSADMFSVRAVEILRYHNQSIPLFVYLPFQSVHAPLQVPTKYIELYKHIKDPSRRNFSAMVTAMDDAVGQVVEALKQYQLYDNSIIIFTTDNGGQILYGGNNYPLRGNKGTLWEGGTRGPALVHSPMLFKSGYISNEIMHAVDWFPTLIALAGGKAKAGVDGVNQWKMISNGSVSSRKQFIYNIDNFNGSLNAAIRVGGYKLIVGNPGKPDGWYPPKRYAKTGLHKSTYKIRFYLFNLKDDPTERHNLAKKLPKKVKQMWAILAEYVAQAVVPFRPPQDPYGSPIYWGGVYSPGWCQSI